MKDNISFTWGDKGGMSKSKEVQFYKNFKYDEITYNLFDNVYLFKDDDPEPHLGKIMKIWSAKGDKKVKIVWFLHPSEIGEHLGSYQPSEKEVFLACGGNEVPGVADINPLDAIAGKCCVICTLKDERNPHPSQADIERADFVFSRLFDASRCTLSDVSDKLPDTIATHNIELFFNKKEDLIPEVVLPAISNGAAENVSIPVPPKPYSLKISGTEANGPRQDERKSLKIRIPSKSIEDGRSKSVQTPAGTHKGEKRPLDTLNEDKVTKRVKLSDEAPGGSGENQIRKGRAEESELRSLPSPSGKSGAKGVVQPEKSPAVSTGVLKNGNKIEDWSEVPRKRDAVGKLKQAVVPSGGLKLQKNAEDQVEQASRRPIDVLARRKWFDFSGRNWAQKIQIEDQEGKVVLLQNFDASFTASEIEDLILGATQHPCTVRLVTNYMYGDPTYGMAYAFFRNKEAANLVVAKLSKVYLVLPDGRPLLCSKGALKIPKQSTSFVGHLAIEKLKKKMTGEEMKKAVSTAHCSQCNTIEFEMAVDWIAAEEKFENASKKLTEDHKQDRKRITKK
ncbi:BAH domain-containing protein [Carex littledalei]|uniref:BAH domain-containing protein n=1 Tax=Carex littledalei TaxID=544730 RepID=A0A833RF59_9POAL|nr:BAH domain-containing protein [Carex littledalei]